MKWKLLRVRMPCLLPVSHASIPSEVKTRPEELIYALSFMTAISLIQLPYEDIDGNPIPTIIFKSQPSTFHAFLISLIFAFSGAAWTIMLREDHPKTAKYSRRWAIVSILASLAILLWALTLAGFRLVAPLIF